MTKRLIDIDDELLRAAQEASGHDTIKGAVTEALTRMVSEERRREQRLRQSWAQLGEAITDLQDEQVMRQAWS